MMSWCSINATKGHQGFTTLPFAERFWSKVDKRGPNECWPWLACRNGKDGYGQFILKGRGPGRLGFAHRIAWELHHGRSFPEGKQACHSCDNRWCVNPTHIWPGTGSENMRDAYQKGRLKLQRRTKLLPDDVRLIRKLREQGTTQVELAKRYGVHTNTIRRVEFGQTWKDVSCR